MAGSIDYTGELAEIPFEPGESPFKIKGVAVRGVFERDKDNPRGIGWCLTQLKDPRLKAYMSQHFLASGWYDIFAFLAVADLRPRAAGATTPAEYARYVRDQGYQQAGIDMKGLFQVLLHLITPNMVGQRVVTIAGKYFDFGKTEMTLGASKHHEGLRSGLPRAILYWHTPALAGYVERVIEIAGAKDPKVVFGPPQNERMQHGVAVVDVTYSLTWS